MKCNKCGSENMTAHVQTSTSYRKGHGCLWTILFGFFYWTWLIIKWIFKLTIAMMWYLLVEWWRAIIIVIQKKPYSKPEWLTKMLRRRGKTYTEHQTVFVCNNCGNTQEAGHMRQNS